MLRNELTRPRDRQAFEIAIFCTLGVEADAMIALFDEIWEQNEQFEKADGDTNGYTIGRICQHYVVLAQIPRRGLVSASTVAANLRHSFPHIRLGLLVGICGAVPFTQTEQEIILGDIIISTHIINSGFGTLYSNRFIRKNSLHDNPSRPCPEIAGFLSKLKGNVARSELEGQIRKNLATLSNAASTYPGAQEDKLFEATYRHKHNGTACSSGDCSENDVCLEALELSCAELGCDFENLIPRARVQAAAREISPKSHCPEVHFGGLASADQMIVNSALYRDRIAEEEGVIGFEMEAAGLWDTVPTIVVKGACDYADSHKNKKWQLYAAATAASCAKGILAAWRKTARPVQSKSRVKEFVTSPTPTQVFSGTFSASKNIHNGGTYTAETISF
ncbi:uncharacterized protein LDX57_010036 [Aspergillus melleus]|uniref:uncharacterized protein n=1 Tax=Aspergillus melleus TaxID=138277 RepID=UPI001E8D0179|nr:uncharacterized protein LDX57_010036 [Aspergillus melleus]KAH8432397.1 hypothetical protein LDX57_010036 [Aspergillus melleus]